MRTLTAKYEVPEYVVRGMEEARELRSAETEADARELFELKYASGSLNFSEAQDFLKFESIRLGAMVDDRGVAWYLDDGVIYRVAEQPFFVKEASDEDTKEDSKREAQVMTTDEGSVKVKRGLLKKAVEEYLTACGTQERADLLDAYIEYIKPKLTGDLASMTEEDLAVKRPAVFAYYNRQKEEQED